MHEFRSRDQNNDHHQYVRYTYNCNCDISSCDWYEAPCRIYSRLTLTPSTTRPQMLCGIRVVCISNNISYFVTCLHWCEPNPNTILLLQPVHRCDTAGSCFFKTWDMLKFKYRSREWERESHADNYDIRKLRAQHYFRCSKTSFLAHSPSHVLSFFIHPCAADTADIYDNDDDRMDIVHSTLCVCVSHFTSSQTSSRFSKRVPD